MLQYAPGLTASPPGGYTLEVARSGYSPFRVLVRGPRLGDPVWPTASENG